MVVTALGKGHFRPVAVKTGVESGDWVEVSEGLSADTEVVTSGQFLLDAEADFEAGMERMAPEKKGGDMKGMDHEGMEMKNHSSRSSQPPVGVRFSGRCRFPETAIARRSRAPTGREAHPPFVGARFIRRSPFSANGDRAAEPRSYGGHGLLAGVRS